MVKEGIKKKPNQSKLNEKVTEEIKKALKDIEISSDDCLINENEDTNEFF